MELTRTYSHNLEFQRTHLVDIRTTANVQRQEKPFWGTRDLNDRQVSAQLLNFVKKARKDGTLKDLGPQHQPLFWKYQPLVVVDPILPCHGQGMMKGVRASRAHLSQDARLYACDALVKGRRSEAKMQEKGG